MKLSIIIPIYNVEDTLDKCIESVISQSFTDYEMILVDDGSPDGSGDICNFWAENDKRIKVIHKNNGGLSDARNAGINIATGDYITFIDSDDHIAPNTLLPLMYELEKHKDYDIIEYPIYVFFGSKKQKILNFDNRTFTDIFNDYWLGCKAYTHLYSCNKIFRRELFNEIRFPIGKKFEDVFTTPEILKKTKKIATSKNGMYYYNWNENSITATANGDDLEMLLQAHLNYIVNSVAHLGKENRNEWIEYYMHVVNIQMDVFELTGKEPELKKYNIGYNAIFSNKINIKLKLKLILLNILGIKKLCLVNKLMHKIAACR